MYSFLRTAVSRKYEAGLEENLLIHIEIESSLEYELEREISMGSILPLYTSSPLILLPLSASSIDFSPSYNIMSQHNLYQIIRQ